MIPEKGKAYHIEFTDPEYPSVSHYEGSGIFTGQIIESINGNLYDMILCGENENGLFGEENIVRALPNPHDGSTLDSFLLEEANNKIKELKELLHETVEYIRSERVLRNTWEGANARLDREADELIEKILKEVHVR